MPEAGASPGEIEIREARPGDVPAIAAIYAEAVAGTLATWEYDPPDLAAMLARFERVTSAGYPWLAAVDRRSGEVVGYASGGPFHPQQGFRFVIENSIYVAHTARRRGIGGLLLNALIEECTRRGFRHMIAGISEPGSEASRRLHEAHGFVLHGAFPRIGWKHGQWLTALYLLRSLGDGSATAPEAVTPAEDDV